jgi:hypothetical protein
MVPSHCSCCCFRARDLPEKTGGIEIYNAVDYLRMRAHWNGCGLLLHELCHLIHQSVFGLDCPVIQDLYQTALASQRYDTVLRRDWMNRATGASDQAYATLNHKEFFAEMSVTYWATGYTELDEADCNDIRACSPPVIENTALLDARLGDKESLWTMVWRWWLDVFTIPPTPSSLKHCNKFYPFTRGQLKSYDVALEREMAFLWHKVAQWKDKSNYNCGRDCSGCWQRPYWNKNQSLVQTHRRAVIHPMESMSDTVEL